MAMDASLLLKRQGWLGTGHSLDEHAGNPSKTSRGLKRPLLVSKKVDVLGVGLNKHAAVSDQWWLRAYDQGLQTLGSGKESALAQAQKHGVNRGGLYGRFVKGEGVPGTIGQSMLGGDVKGQPAAQVVHTVQVGEGGLPTPVDSDGDGTVKRKEKGERKRKREGEEGKKEKSKKDKKDKKTTSSESEDKAAKKARKEAKKGKKSSTAQEEVLDPEKRALYTKRAAEKGVSLEVYVKRRQEKYAAKKDEKRK